MVNLADFPVNAGSVELSDNTRAIVNVSERLDPIDLSDESRLQYLGNPAFGEVETSGTSAIHWRDKILPTRPNILLADASCSYLSWHINHT